jgi:hypothetical protein
VMRHTRYFFFLLARKLTFFFFGAYSVAVNSILFLLLGISIHIITVCVSYITALACLCNKRNSFTILPPSRFQGITCSGLNQERGRRKSRKLEKRVEGATEKG